MLSNYHPLHLVLGLVIWSIWFVFIYGFLSLGCVYLPAQAHGWINTVLFFSTILIVCLLIYLAYRMSQIKAASKMLTWISISVYLCAAAVTLIIGFTSLFLPACL